MPKYNDFDLDVVTTKLNEENIGSIASDVSRHNSCAGRCGSSVISALAIKCVPRPRTELWF